MGMQISGEVLHIGVARREVGQDRDYATWAFDLGLKGQMKLLQLEQEKENILSGEKNVEQKYGNQKEEVAEELFWKWREITEENVTGNEAGKAS